MKYIVFAFSNDSHTSINDSKYPIGGADDIIGGGETIDDCKALLTRLKEEGKYPKLGNKTVGRCTHFQILLVGELKIVFSGKI